MPPSPTLCLSMIVKNESKILERMFDSVVKHIDAYCICDTGSTDNTVELIKNYFSKHPRIQGKIIHEPFRNFSYNRNIALRECKGLSDFVLLMDADMVLEWKNFDKASLFQADLFTLLQGFPGFMYRNTRIIRYMEGFRYRGATHEYMDCPSLCISKGLSQEEMFILDIGDGGAKSDKAERDIRLLLKSIEDEPENERSYFYLANTYFDTGSLDLAEEYYKKRIALGGWEQEMWYSMYRLGLVAIQQKKPERAVACWLDACETVPRRIENLYEIVKYYRVEGKTKTARAFYDRALHALAELSTQEKSDFLFLHNDIYTYKLFYEWTIIAFYEGVRDIRKEWLRVLKHGTDYTFFHNMLTNMPFYDFSLPLERTHDYTMTCVYKDTTYRSSSSSLLPHPNGGYVANVRFVNYAYDKSTGQYRISPSCITTVNARVHLDTNFLQTSMEWLPVSIHDPPRLYHGVEDVRLFRFPSGEIYFTGTGYHKNDTLGVVVGKYPKDIDSPRELRQSFNPGTPCEKNWVFVHPTDETSPLIVYRWHPLQLCRMPTDDDKDEIVVAREVATPSFFQAFRGSTHGVVFEDKIWFVVHLVEYGPPRKYYHLVLVWDDTMTKILYTSAPFTFEKQDIEYCIGLVVENKRLLFMYSTWDETSKIAVVPRSSFPLFEWSAL